MQPQDAEAVMIANLAKLTGRSLDEWSAVVTKSGLAKHGEIVKMLKSEHAVTHGYANLIAHKTLKSDAASTGSDDELVAAQYSGEKADLRPIHDKLEKAIRGFGMVSHRVRVSTANEVDAELIQWLREAYEQA
jgi:hypothetical protein